MATAGEIFAATGMWPGAEWSPSGLGVAETLPAPILGVTGTAIAPYIQTPQNIQTPQIMEAGIGGLLPLIGGLLGRFAPEVISGVSGLLGGLGVSSILGGNGAAIGAVIPGTDIALGGPGAAEPSASIIAKQWKGIGGSQFYQLINGKVVVRKANGVWRLIRRPKMLHMKVSNPRMGDVVKANKIVARTAKILKRRLK